MSKSDNHLPPLDSLQQRINEAKSQQDKDKGTDQPDVRARSYGNAMNLAGGLVSGSAVGAVGGYYLDRWLGLSPLFLITGFFLGFACGLFNLMRSANKEAKEEDS